MKKNELLSFKKIKVSTLENDFVVQNEKKIIIKGNKFDASNLAKFFNTKNNGNNNFKNINNEIQIDLKNIKAPLSEKLENFILIGEIKKGQFMKVSSKGDFGGDNFLDISMKKDKNSEKNIRNIFRSNKTIIN